MSIIDTFDRPDNSSTLGTTSDASSTWTPVNVTWGISSNQAYRPSGTPGDGYAIIDTGSSDGTVQVTVMPTTWALGQVFRYVDTSHYWRIYAKNGTNLSQIESSDGTGHHVWFNFTVTSGDVIKVTMSGNVITVYQNGTQIFTRTDNANATATKHGLYAEQNNGGFLDNWSFTPPATLPFQINAALGLNGLTAEVDVTLTSYPDSGPYTYNIDWGDGNTSTATTSSLTQSFFHPYLDSSGAYTIAAWVTESFTGTNNYSDTFNRADSVGVINPASDGGSWTQFQWQWQILSQKLSVNTTVGGGQWNTTSVCSSNGGPGGFTTSGACGRNIGGSSQTVQGILYSNSSGNAHGHIYINLDPFGNGSAYIFDLRGGGIYRANSGNNGDMTGLGSFSLSAAAGFPNTGTVVKAVHDGHGNISIYLNGVLAGSCVDSSPLTGTWCALLVDAGGSIPAWGNFSAISTALGGTRSSNTVYLFPSWGYFGNQTADFYPRHTAQRRQVT